MIVAMIAGTGATIVAERGLARASQAPRSAPLGRAHLVLPHGGITIRCGLLVQQG